VKIDIENVPVDDQKTFEMLARGETMGLFQLGGSGMTRYLQELKPSSIHDINAMVALYRPGPMESIPKYIERKHNPRFINYLDPRLEEILERSYGVVTYQDDVLMIAIKLAGYSWLEADALRKAMGKKIPAEMEAQKEKLKKGLVDHGMSHSKAEEIWRLIEPFAAYGFNKSHAASYGKVAYQTAYMKANYPVEYMCAVLTNESGDVDKIAEIIGECKRMELAVLPPDINESFGGFTIVNAGAESERSLGTDSLAGSLAGSDPAKAKIRFGLYTIKNFGQAIADAIIAERKENGRFASLQDFLGRIRNRNLNKKTLEALIMSGALDTLNIDRGVMLANIDTLLAYNRECEKAPKAEDTLFGVIGADIIKPSLILAEAEAASYADKLRWEKELLGLYVSGHPLERVRDKLEARTTNISKIKIELKDGMLAVVAGLVEQIKPILTKKGDKMLFTTVADFSDKIEVVVFPKVLVEYKDIIQPESTLAIRGRISHRNGSVSMIAEAVKEL
jgi:DNA polymerase-3 subunit alpha